MSPLPIFLESSLMDWLKDYLPSIVALVALFVGPLISLRITNKQISASAQLNRRQIISPMRQVWMNDLRNKTSELLHLLDRLYLFFHGGKEIHDIYKRLKWEFAPSDADGKIDLLNYEIVLMLNGTENDHRNFSDLIHKCKMSVYNNKITNEEFYGIHRDIMRLCTSILRSEWDKVKNE